MTGYGKGESVLDGRTLTVELKTVNNRYLDINTRLPKPLAFCDDIIRKTIQKTVKRGTVDVYINYENRSEDSKVINIDLQLAGEYAKAAKQIRTEFMLENDFQTTALMRTPDVLKVEYGKDAPEQIEKMTENAVLLAVRNLDSMREIEGSGIQKNLADILAKIVNSLKFVTVRAPIVVGEYRQKLQQRIQEVLKQVEVDENKLLNEVAFFADKADINEEIQRLSSHIDQFVTTLDSSDQQGRKLDFISQEMNREINTIGSKSNDMEITNQVIAMKNELEKLKEQIRNVE